jgi:hypothetical protein
VFVRVTDDVPGTPVAEADCKRHWRTDSVEIAIDPRADSGNTSTTFKVGVIAATSDGGSCFGRDADHRQGPGPVTAPGMTVATGTTGPYIGYTIEAAIPFAVLPAAVDPAQMGLNLLVYDSDTRDLTGQTRIGWSTWGGVQGDPYRWGRATVQGYTPPADLPTTAPDPTIPSVALSSMDSPPSILSALRNGVPLAGTRLAPPAARGVVAFAREPGDASGPVLVKIDATVPGRMHLFALDEHDNVVGQTVFDVSDDNGGRTDLVVSDVATRVVGAWSAGRAGTFVSAVNVSPG